MNYIIQIEILLINLQIIQVSQKCSILGEFLTDILTIYVKLHFEWYEMYCE